MAISDSKLAEINRENARHSTGPRTEAGKSRSRRNALKHGLRAEKLALPNEDPKELAAREEDFRAHYNPQNPTEAVFLQVAVQSAILLDRCAQFFTSTVAEQVRTAVARVRIRSDNEVKALRELLPKDSEKALEGLRSSAAGCAYLIREWTAIQNQILKNNGCTWNTYQLTRQLGARFSDRLCDGPNETYERTEARKLALEQIPRILADLAVREELLRPLAEESNPEPIQARAMLVEDPARSALYLRYHGTALSAFCRMTTALDKALKEQPRAALAPSVETEPEADPVSWGDPEEPPPVTVPAEAEAPNEPDAPQETPCSETTCDEPPAPEPATPTGFEPGRYLFPPAILEALDSIRAQESIDEQVKAAQATQNHANRGETL